MVGVGPFFAPYGVGERFTWSLCNQESKSLRTTTNHAPECLLYVCSAPKPGALKAPRERCKPFLFKKIDWSRRADSNR